jgi:hypothetical protein
VSNYGLKLTSISGAPVRLEALEITNIYGPSSDVTQQLSKHYLGNIKGNILRVAASSDSLGNPYNFVNTLGSGVKNFYYEPRDGFMQGPIQGGIGVLKGTAGVVSSGAAAVTGVVGKLTNSVGRSVVMLSFDE